jgi:hypothetical protein
MLFIKVNPNGTIEELTVEGESYPVLRHAVGGMIEPIYWSEDLASYHNEEFLYAEGEEFDSVNLVVALMGAKVYGPVIFTGNVDEDGETAGLSEANADTLRDLAVGVRLAHAELYDKFQSPRQAVTPVVTITAW